MMRSKLSLVVGFCAVALGCGGGDDDGGGGVGGGAGAGVGGAGVGGAGAGGAGAGGAGSGGAGSGGAGSGGAGSGGMAGMPAPLDPTFTNIVDTIFPGCSGPTCHSSVVGGNLMLMGDKATVHAALLADGMGVNLPPDPTKTDCRDTGLKRVVAGMPEMSLLYLKLQTTMEPPCGLRMPTGGMLPAHQIELIRAWIAAGANND